MKEFWKAALIRALRTMAQTAIAMIGSAVAIEAVDWKFVVSASLLAGLLSILTSVATGLPEAGSADIDDEQDLHEFDGAEEELDEEFDEVTEGDDEDGKAEDA